jgi:hypothetical protein
MPSLHKILFFTPELYRRYNSQREKTALAADAEWEAAIVRYHEYLATLRGKTRGSGVFIGQFNSQKDSRPLCFSLA